MITVFKLHKIAQFNIEKTDNWISILHKLIQEQKLDSQNKTAYTKRELV
jgi:hypothetical protein